MTLRIGPTFSVPWSRKRLQQSAIGRTSAPYLTLIPKGCRHSSLLSVQIYLLHMPRAVTIIEHISHASLCFFIIRDVNVENLVSVTSAAGRRLGSLFHFLIWLSYHTVDHIESALLCSKQWLRLGSGHSLWSHFWPFCVEVTRTNRTSTGLFSQVST